MKENNIHRIFHVNVKWLLLLFPLGFLIIFFYTPLASISKVVIQKTINEGQIIIASSQVLKPLAFTFYQAGLSTLATLILGLPTAYLFSHFNFHGKKFLNLVSTLPFILPTVVVAASFNSLFGSKGWINILLMQSFALSSPPIMLSGSLTAIVVAHVFYNTAIVNRVVGSAWVQLDPRTEQAAQVLGANRWDTFWHVTLPRLAPAILAAALLVFLFDFTSFGVVLLLGNPSQTTLEVEIFTQTMSLFNLPLAAFLALIQLICTMTIMLMVGQYANRWSIGLLPKIKTVFSLRPMTSLQKWFARLFTIVLIIFFLLPLIALVMRSITFGELTSGSSSFTFSNYLALFKNDKNSLFYIPPIRAIFNSIVFGLITVLISLPMALLSAYAIRSSGRFGKWLQAGFFLPLGTSAVVLGLGMIIAFNQYALPSIFLVLLIPLVHSLIAFPFVLRIIQPAIAAIPGELRQAAATLGASPWKVWKQVDLPILYRAIGVAAVFAFSISLGEFGATSFLTRPEVPTIPIAIARFLSQPGALQYGQALAMSSILLFISAASLILIDRSQ